MSDSANTENTATEIDVVQSFLRALESMDIAAVLDLADDTIVYQNVPLRPARGRAAFERQMRWFERHASGFEARIHAIAANGPTVLTERTDVIESGKFRTEFWVCGTFEVRDGRIVLWRDYFDYANVAIASLKGALRALVGSVRPSPPDANARVDDGGARLNERLHDRPTDSS
jgi:limonene-1,2-epoxide hydrolase